MPTTPLLFYDNVFDTWALYPSALLDALSAAINHEAFRVGDGRRDRTWWQPTNDAGGAPGNWIRVDLGASVTRGVDYLWLDRGHNLWGKTITIEGASNAAFSASLVSQAFTVPAAGTIGGDPTWPAMSVTEEGCCYSVSVASPALAARRYWRFRVNYVAAFVPIVTGVMLGLKQQLLGYSRVFDEDAGERTDVGETSRAGYMATDYRFSWRTALLDLGFIGSTEYDNDMRAARRALFQKDVPVALFMDYVTRPERGWCFKYDGNKWGMPKTRVYRDGQIQLREHGHVL